MSIHEKMGTLHFGILSSFHTIFRMAFLKLKKEIGIENILCNNEMNIDISYD